MAVLPDDWQKGGFGLYVHWPYCVSKCPYCDFNSHVAGQVDQGLWQTAYLAALEFYAQQTSGRTLRSIYFGGGTPSLMRPDLVAAIIDTAQRIWAFDNDIEITLEANPNSVEVNRFRGFRQAGINRISLGVQALNDADLRKLGRMHTASEALTALEIANNVFDRVSFDLIYARQDQSLDNWASELGFALSFHPDHLSLYQLSIEPDTVFGARARAGKLPGLPQDDLAAEMFKRTSLICDNNGLKQYEVSNFARDEAFSKHNMIYWQAGDYLGIGPGAHGRISLPNGRFATETPLEPRSWLEAVSNGSGGESLRMILDGHEQVIEYLLMGLRTLQGVSLPRLRSMNDWAPDPDIVNHLSGLGLIRIQEGRLQATAAGIPLLNPILRNLAP